MPKINSDSVGKTFLSRCQVWKIIFSKQSLLRICLMVMIDFLLFCLSFHLPIPVLMMQSDQYFFHPFGSIGEER